MKPKKIQDLIFQIKDFNMMRPVPRASARGSGRPVGPCPARGEAAGLNK
jgi:hypothetical protein